MLPLVLGESFVARQWFVSINVALGCLRGEGVSFTLQAVACYIYTYISSNHSEIAVRFEPHNYTSYVPKTLTRWIHILSMDHPECKTAMGLQSSTLAKGTRQIHYKKAAS